MSALTQLFVGTVTAAESTSGVRGAGGRQDLAARSESGTAREERHPARQGPRVTGVAESAGLRVIRLHDARHGTATLLTAAGVAPRVMTENSPLPPVVLVR